MEDGDIILTFSNFTSRVRMQSRQRGKGKLSLCCDLVFSLSHRRNRVGRHHSDGVFSFIDLGNKRACFDDDLGFLRFSGGIIGLVCSEGGNEYGGLGTDGNKVGGRGSELF
nr:hypothetical protein [Tanacetum cinerariifolium]